MLFDLISYDRLHGIARWEHHCILARGGPHWMTDLDDAIQEALIRCWECCENYDPEKGTAGAFFRAMIRRSHIDLIRKRTRRGKGEDVCVPMEGVDVAEDLRHVATQLTPGEIRTGRKEWILEQLAVGESVPRLARLLEMSESAVYRIQHLSRG